MRTSLHLCPVIFLAFVLAACGKGDASRMPDGVDSYRRGIPVENEKQAQEKLALSIARCADRSRCDEAVGMVVVATPKMVQMCTGFLVAPDLVMTSGHCVAEFTDQSPEACSGRVEVVFPDTLARPAERARCARRVGGQIAARDYAFFKLERSVVRRPLALSGLGISDSEVLIVAKMDTHSSDSFPIGELKMETCKGVLASWLLPQSDRALSGMQVVSGCTLEPSHSGAPLLDAWGGVRGVISRGVDFSELPPVADQLEAPGHFGLATNVACIERPGQAGVQLPGSCHQDLSLENTAQLRARLLVSYDRRGIERKLLEAARAWAEESDTVLNWIPFTLAEGAGAYRKATLVPVCFHPRESHEGWLRRYRSMGNYPEKGSLELLLPVWETHVGLNSRLQLDVRLNSVYEKGMNATVFFSPQKLARRGVSPVRLHADVFAGPEQEREIAFCR